MPAGVYERPDPVTRFWAKVDKRGPRHPKLGYCWQWTGKPHRSGYGRHRGPEGVMYAHRYAYTLLVGPIADRLQVDHRCNNTMCVRPSHLEAVTQHVNMLRGPRNACAVNARKTRCIHGHPLSGANLYQWRNGRYCRTCRLARLAATRGTSRKSA